MTARILSCLIGYAFGCFLTGELVARIYTGKSAASLGYTGNPGMANIMQSLGFKPGILVLIGDLLKVILAVILCRLLFRSVGRIVTLYAGLGCTLGHDFPFWRRFRGGKGVAASSAAITLYAPLWSLVAHLFGIVVTLSTKYLCLAGPVVPLVFGVCMVCLGDWEAAAISGVFLALALFCHSRSILGIRRGETKQTDVIAALRKKRKSKREPDEKDPQA